MAFLILLTSPTPVIIHELQKGRTSNHVRIYKDLLNLTDDKFKQELFKEKGKLQVMMCSKHMIKRTLDNRQWAQGYDAVISSLYPKHVVYRAQHKGINKKPTSEIN